MSSKRPFDQLPKTNAATYDRAEALRVMASLNHASLRSISLPELRQGITDLQRAGVRLNGNNVMPGRALLEQCHAEEERRARLGRLQAPRHQPAPIGSYSAILDQRNQDRITNPLPKYHEYR